MCGIAGFLSKTIELDKKKLKKVKTLMSIRGPDGFGKYQFDLKNKKKVCLLHSRLMIIDPTEKSNQPMKDENGILIFNGMIYNYLEIKKDLISKNIKFNTNSDTEVLLKFLNYYGPNKLEKLDGMWAFAYFNFKNKNLILSRDKFGEKPLYFSFRNKKFIFGSNPNYILSLDDQGYKPNYSKLTSFIENSFRGLYFDNQSLFENISQLNPGSFLKLSQNNKIEIKKYWSPEKNNLKTNKKYSNVVNILKKKFKKSIEKRLISDFPISCALSGGIDSGSIVSIAKKKFNKKINCFSIEPKNKNYNENKNILSVVRQNNLNHNFVKIKKDNNKNLNILEDIIKKTSNFVPTTTWLIFDSLCKKIKRSNHKVILSGAGGDEMYGGYYMHHLHFLYSIRNENYFNIKLNEWKKYVLPLIRNNNLKDFKNFKNLKSDSDRKFLEYLHNRTYIKKRSSKMKMPNLKNKLDYFKKNLFLDFFHYSLPGQLTPMDNIAMYNGLENRSPLLSGEIYKYLLSVPTKFYIQKGYNKKILRDMLKDILPKKIIKDRNKIGFFMDIDSIFDFKSPKIKNLIFKNKFIKKTVYLNKIDEIFKKNNKNNQESHFLLSLINISLFLKNYEGKNTSVL
jgi:asparagine synthase (glutamine-hydrolysing)